MTAIVLNNKEGKILADRYIVVVKENTPRMKDIDYDIANKLGTTEDNYLHYCFDRVVREELKALIFNYIIRYENGTLGEDEKLVLPDYMDKRDLGVYILTKRNAYQITKPANKKDGPRVTKVNGLVTNNKSGLGTLMLGLGFTTEDAFKTIRGANMAASEEYDTLSRETLTLIPMPKKAKAKAKKVSK